MSPVPADANLDVSADNGGNGGNNRRNPRVSGVETGVFLGGNAVHRINPRRGGSPASEGG
jgi:hypothetical protein